MPPSVRVRLPRLPILRQLTLSAPVISEKAARQRSREDAADERRGSGEDHQEGQCHAAGLVRILQTQLSQCVWQSRYVGADAAAFDPEKTVQTTRPGWWNRSSPLAEYLLSAARPLQSQRGARAALSAFVIDHRLESRMREIRTSGSEGGAESSSVPTPYRYVKIASKSNPPSARWPFGTMKIDITPSSSWRTLYVPCANMRFGGPEK
jgi:hypothetical protein